MTCIVSFEKYKEGLRQGEALTQDLVTLEDLEGFCLAKQKILD